jgi:hypothetical protein
VLTSRVPYVTARGDFGQHVLSMNLSMPVRDERNKKI